MNNLQIDLTWHNNELNIVDTSLSVEDSVLSNVKNYFTVVEFITYGNGEVYDYAASSVSLNRTNKFYVQHSGKYSYYCMYLPSIEFISSQNNAGELYWDSNAGAIKQYGSGDTVDFISAYDYISNIGTADQAFYYPKVNLFSLYSLKVYLAQLQNKTLCSECNNMCESSTDRLKRDFLFNAVQVVQYLIDTDNLEEAHRIVDNISKNILCVDDINNNSCCCG